MDLAVKEVDTRPVEVDREFAALRLILIHFDIRPGWFHQQGDGMFGAGATVIDLEIDSLPRLNNCKRSSGICAFEPVTGLIREAHRVGCPSVRERYPGYTRRGREQNERHSQP
jgi:hypothetical protein